MQLEELARRDAEQRAERVRVTLMEKKRQRAERAARGEEEHESDLEDDDVALEADSEGGTLDGGPQQQVSLGSGHHIVSHVPPAASILKHALPVPRGFLHYTCMQARVLGEEAHHRLLSCMSLSKLTGDYVAQHEAESTGRALKSLVTHKFNALEATEWSMKDVRHRRPLCR